MNYLLSILFIFSIFLNNSVSKKIKPSLLSNILDYNVIKAAFNNQSTIDSDKLKYGVDLYNLDTLAKLIASNEDPIGEGQFGKVFKYNKRLLPTSDLTIPVAVKEIFINNNYNSTTGQEEQDMVDDEIIFNLGIKELDPNGFFFPIYFGTYDVTDYFPTFVTNISRRSVKSYLKPDRNQELLLLEMEFFDQAIYKYTLEIAQGKVNPYFHTRMKIGESIAKGLLMMYDTYLHCDIKPENIMARILNKQEMDALAEAEVARVELFPGKFYQIKLIDFGLVASGEPGKRRCNGGTPGFLPDEFFNGKTHETFDIYSLAMLLLDNEMAIQKLDFFSDTRAEVDYCTRNNSAFTTKQKNSLKLNSYFKLAIYFSNKADYNAYFFEKVREYFPNVDSMISNSFSGKTMEQVSLDTYIFGKPKMFDGIMKAALDTYINQYRPNVQIPKILQDRELDSINATKAMNAISDKESERFLKAKEKAQYLSYLKEIFENKVEIEKMTHQYLLSQITVPTENRDPMETFLENISTFRKEFEGALEEQLKYVLKYERHNMFRVNNSVVNAQFSMTTYEINERQKRPSFKLDDNFLVLI